MNKVFSIILMLGSIVGLVGCSFSGPEKVEKSSISVLYWDKSSFMDTYGGYLNMEFPQFDFNVIPLKQAFAGNIPPNAQIEKLMNDEKPDILFLQLPQYQYLQKKNLLQELNSGLKAGSLRLEDLNRNIINQIQDDNDAIYGLPSTVNTNMIFFNNDIFNKLGIIVPPSPINWNSLFELLGKFTGNRENIAGLTFEGGDLWSVILKIGVDQGIKFADLKSKKTTLATPAWESLVLTMTELFKNHVIRFNNETNNKFLDSFSQGKAAVTITTNSYIDTLQAAENNKQLSFSWSYSPFPIANNGSTKSPIQIEEMISINRNSPNQQNAFSVLSFLLGKKMQPVYEGKGKITTRIPDFAGNSTLLPYEALYQPSSSVDLLSYGELMETLSKDYKRCLTKTGEREMEEIIAGNTDIASALKRIENEVVFEYSE